MRKLKEKDIQFEKERFQREYPIKKERAKVLNFLQEINQEWNPEKLPKLTKYIQVSIPYSSNLSKNVYSFMKYKGILFIPKVARELQNDIILLIKAQKPNFKIGKLWIDILVQKPKAMGDAVNFVDRICDAIQKATGINDSWFSLRKVDWQIVKKNPKIVIGIGQEYDEDCKICSMCGRILPVKLYFVKFKGNKKPYTICKSCRSRKINEITI